MTEVQLGWKMEVPSGLLAACEASSSAPLLGYFLSYAFFFFFFRLCLRQFRQVGIAEESPEEWLDFSSEDDCEDWSEWSLHCLGLPMSLSQLGQCSTRCGSSSLHIRKEPSRRKQA